MSEIQLNDVQITVLQDILSEDPEFRNIVQERFKKEAENASLRASLLIDLASIGGVEITPRRNPTSPAKRTASQEQKAAKPAAKASKGQAKSTTPGRGRPKGTLDDSSKIGAVMSYINEYPGSSIKDIANGLDVKGIDMSDSMLNTYLYKLNKRGDIRVSGDRGNRSYFLKK